MRLPSSYSLPQVVDILGAHGYSGSIPTEGWGGVDFEIPEGGVDPNSLRQSPGAPRAMIIEGAEGRDGAQAIEIALARFLFDRVDQALRRRLPESTDLAEEQLYRLDAIDLAIVPSPFDPSEYVVYASSYSTPDLKRMSEVFNAALGGSDGGANQLQVGYRAFAADHDLFLWLLDRQDRGGDLGLGLRIDEIERLMVSDRLNQGVRILDMATLNREVVAWTVQDEMNRFGPGRLWLTDENVGASYYCELNLDGSFSLFVGESEFLDGRPLNTPAGRLRAVLDFGGRTLTTLYQAHAQDEQWDEFGRADLRTRARDSVRAFIG